MITELMTKIQALEPGEELYQSYRHDLPTKSELAQMLVENAGVKVFEAWETINGYVIMRKA